MGKKVNRHRVVGDKVKNNKKEYPTVEDFLRAPLDIAQSDDDEVRENMTKLVLLISSIANSFGEKELFYACVMRVCHNLTMSCFEHNGDIEEVKDDMVNFMEECFVGHWERICKFTEKNMIKPKVEE